MKWIESNQPRIGTQGWKQFLSAKKKMSEAFNIAKEQSNAHIVPTSRGTIAETEVRKWLSEFLPKRYGVTSGYIVSQGRSDKVKLPHFDVIIYNKLDSPVLWVEGESNIQDRNNTQAIPVEYVHGVFEVKSSLTSQHAKEAINHLLELKPLLEKVDAKDSPYKRYLPLNFTCGVVFFELLKKHEYSKSAINNLIPSDNIRGYHGGIILEGEGWDKNKAGKIRYTKLAGGGANIKKGKDSLLLPSINSDNSFENDDETFRINLSWYDGNFAIFAFELINQLQGTFVDGNVHSFYGMSFHSVSDNFYNDK